MLLREDLQSGFRGLKRSLLMLPAFAVFFCFSGSINSVARTKTEPTVTSAPSPATIPLIPEQDPDGLLWGLRDTLTHKLVLNYTYHKIWEFNEGFALVMLDGKFGLINKNGRQVIAPEFESPGSVLQCGIIAFESVHGQMMLFDTSGKNLSIPLSGTASFLPCHNRMVCGSNQVQLCDLKGQPVNSTRFVSLHLLPEGLCIATLADEKGYKTPQGLYDLDGKQLLPHAFEYIDGFYCGRALVKKNGKYGVIDQTGKELFYTDYGRIDRYFNDHAIVYKSHPDGNHTVGIINKNGREVVPPVYQWLDQVMNFNEGLAAMASKGKYGFVDLGGKPVTPFRYDRVQSFENGIAKVWVGWKYTGYINKTGEEIIPPVFEAMDQTNLRRYHGKFIIGTKEQSLHVFNYRGEKLHVLDYETIGEFNTRGKYFLASKNYRYGILDSAFNPKVPLIYEGLEEIFPGRIAAWKDGKIGFIDLQGKVLSPFIYEQIESYQDQYMDRYKSGAAKVQSQGRTGIINSYGKVVVPLLYEEIENFSHGLAVVKRKGKYGFVNAKGKEVIPPVYESAGPFNAYSAEVTLEGETFQVDAKGTRLEEEY